MTQTVTFTEDRTTPELEALRRRHGVRLVDGKEDGTGMHRLPNGVYGYTYSPGLPHTPLFSKSGAHMFEVHKTAEGSAVLIGFVTPGAVEQFATEAPEFDLSLYPGKRDTATTVLAVPMNRVLRLKPQAFRETGAIELRIGRVDGPKP